MLEGNSERMDELRKSIKNMKTYFPLFYKYFNDFLSIDTNIQLIFRCNLYLDEMARHMYWCQFLDSSAFSGYKSNVKNLKSYLKVDVNVNDKFLKFNDGYFTNFGSDFKNFLNDVELEAVSDLAICKYDLKLYDNNGLGDFFKFLTKLTNKIIEEYDKEEIEMSLTEYLNLILVKKMRQVLQNVDQLDTNIIEQIITDREV